MKNRHTLSLVVLLVLASLSLCGTMRAQCITSATNGSCGAYVYPPITESNGFNTYVLNNVWNPPIGSYQQTLHSTNPGNWYVIANFPTDTTGAIHSYPDTQQLYATSAGGPLYLSSLNNIYSSFSETGDHSSTTVGDYGYDIWLDNYAWEVFIQHDVVNTPDCTTYTTVLATNVQFGGTNGVPVMSWNVCQYGTSELIFQLPSGGGKNFGITSGSVDILGMLNWLYNHGYLPRPKHQRSPIPILNQITYGFEISTTGGLDKTFAVNSLSITSN